MASHSPTFTQWIIAGGAAGISTDLLLFPIDTVKTRLQSAEGFRRAGGFRGVYQGVGSVLSSSVPRAASFFATYDSLKQHLPLPASLDSLNHVISSSVAEVASCVVHVPAEVIKTRTQASAYGKVSASSLMAARETFNAEGVRGFYRGFGITIGCEVPFTAIQFPLYELFKAHLSQYLNRQPLYGHEAGLCGFVAGGIAAALTTPLDVLKTRVMLDMQASSHASKPTFWKHLRGIYEHEQLRVLFAGTIPRVLWMSTGGAIFLGVYEWAMHGLMGYKIPDRHQ